MPAEVHPPVQMGPCHASGGTDFGNDFALLYTVADRDVNLVQMEKARAEFVAVIDDQGTTGEKHIGNGQGHDTCCRGDNRRPHRRRDIDTEMRPTRFPIEHPLATVHARDRAAHRPDETAEEILAIVIARPGKAYVGDVLANTRQLLWLSRSHLTRRQSVDPLNPIVPL